MLLVIAGAGASFDSSPDLPPTSTGGHRPPLADSLFQSGLSIYNDARSRYPQLFPLLARLINRIENQSVEQVLQRVYKEAEVDSRYHSQLTAVQYYLQFLITQVEAAWLHQIGGVTNQIALVDRILRYRIKDTKTCIVTFNYDRLIEHSLNAHRYSIAGINDYISHDIQLFKLHGSINWVRRVFGEQISESFAPDALATAVISNAPTVKRSEEIYFHQSAPPGVVDHFAHCPALAIPVVGKSVFECPKEHLTALESLLPSVTKVLTIGWRGAEDHFFKMLQTKLKPGFRLMTCFGGNSGAADEEVLRRRFLEIGCRVDGAELSGFSRLVVSRDLDAFLAR